MKMLDTINMYVDNYVVCATNTPNQHSALVSMFSNKTVMYSIKATGIGVH